MMKKMNSFKIYIKQISKKKVPTCTNLDFKFLSHDALNKKIFNMIKY